MARNLTPIGHTGREIRRQVTFTIPEHLYESWVSFIKQEEFTSETRAAVALIEISLGAVAPRQMLERSGRIEAYNDTRYWVMQQVGLALKSIGLVIQHELQGVEEKRSVTKHVPPHYNPHT